MVEIDYRKDFFGVYIHLGNKTVVHHRDVVGIFDIERTTVSKQTREYLAQSEKNGIVVNVVVDIPKSFVICENKYEGDKLYISQISSMTLKKRAKSMTFATE